MRRRRKERKGNKGKKENREREEEEEDGRITWRRRRIRRRGRSWIRKGKTGKR